MNSHSIESSVRGHHVYKDCWTPVIGQTLSTMQEEGNPKARFAVAVTHDDRTVGHMPQEISRTSWYIFEHGGEISCEVTGRRRLSDIRGKGLEVPCTYTYKAKARLVRKLIELLPGIFIVL